jgi:predicted transcriptional regulator
MSIATELTAGERLPGRRYGLTRRGEVLVELRRLGYRVSCGDLAEIMGRPSYAVANALSALYSRDLIDRIPVVGARQRFVYLAKSVTA